MSRLISAVALFAVAACGPSTSTVRSTPAPISAARASANWMATLTPVAAASVRGMAMVHTMGDRQTVEIQISGGAPAAVYPWHIHTGSCSDGMTPIVGGAQLYTPLGTSNDGSASLTADLPVTLAADQRYHVNVHASPTDMATIVSCGDLAVHDM